METIINLLTLLFSENFVEFCKSIIEHIPNNRIRAAKSVRINAVQTKTKQREIIANTTINNDANLSKMVSECEDTASIQKVSDSKDTYYIQYGKNDNNDFVVFKNALSILFENYGNGSVELCGIEATYCRVNEGIGKNAKFVPVTKIKDSKESICKIEKNNTKTIDVSIAFDKSKTENILLNIDVDGDKTFYSRISPNNKKSVAADQLLKFNEFVALLKCHDIVTGKYYYFLIDFTINNKYLMIPTEDLTGSKALAEFARRVAKHSTASNLNYDNFVSFADAPENHGIVKNRKVLVKAIKKQSNLTKKEN